MAAPSIPSLCPICKEPISPGDGRVAGLDQSERGAAPVNIYTHRRCFAGCVVVRPGQSFAEAVALAKAPVQAGFFSRDNALLAAGGGQ